MSFRFQPLLPVALALAPVAIVAPAYATQYLNVEQAQKALFPDAAEFSAQTLKLSPAQRERIESESKVRVRKDEQPVWQVKGANGSMQGWFIVDEVVGKHEFITYALALNADGAIRGIEIMEYRETHGGQVRNASWRSQFQGKSYGAALMLDEDIRNISGATLSCKHIADGVRRLLTLHHVALGKS